MSVWIFLTKICERAFWPTDICDVTMTGFILAAPRMFVQNFMAIRWKVVETFHSKGNQNKNSRRIYRIGFILWEPSTSLQTSTSQSLNHFIRVSWVQLTVKTGIGTSRTTLRRTKLNVSRHHSVFFSPASFIIERYHTHTLQQKQQNHTLSICEGNIYRKCRKCKIRKVIVINWLCL